MNDNKDEKKKIKENIMSRFSLKDCAGLIICLILFLTGFIIHGNLGLYFNLAGILIVTGGTFCVAFICFSFERIMIVLKVLSRSFNTRVKTADEIVELLVDLSVKSKLQGLLSLQDDEEETTQFFLRQSLGYLVDGYNTEEIREFLSAEIYFFKIRREETERVLMMLADISPSFGLIGSVVGLISMLSGVGDTSVILKTVPVALTSTLYGIIFANFIFMPFAAKIRERTDKEVLLQKIILEGTIAIGSELHPRVLEKKLKSFLTPSAREGKLVSLKRIKEMFEVEKQAQ